MCVYGIFVKIMFAISPKKCLVSTNPEDLHHVLDFFSCFIVEHCRFEEFLPFFLQVITMVAHSLEMSLATCEILILCVPEIFSSLF